MKIKVAALRVTEKSSNKTRQSNDRRICMDIDRVLSLNEIQQDLCKNGHSKIDKTKILKPTGSLMKNESIAECSPWSILQNF